MPVPGLSLRAGHAPVAASVLSRWEVSMLPRVTVRPLLVLCALALLPAARISVSAQQPTLPDVLHKAAEAVAPLADPSRMYACDELYKQSFTRLKETGQNLTGMATRSGVEGDTTNIREWIAELAVVDTPDNEALGQPWIEFRDVTKLDGKPLRDGKSRLGTLATQPIGVAGPDALDITQDTARLRFGRFLRAVLLPRLPQVFLYATNQARFEFKKAGERTIDGTKTWEVKFQEKTKPTIYRASGDKDAPTSGSFWIDPATGRVLVCTYKNGEPNSVFSEITITYELDQATGLSLPAKLTEKTVDDDDQSRVEATGTFTKWRVVPRK